jgi:hypothetical protein
VFESRSSRIIIIIGIFILFLLISVWLPWWTKRQGAVSSNQGGDGLALLHGFLEKHHSEDYIRWREGVFSIEQLSGVKTFLLSSPKAFVTQREAKTLKNFVEAGGSLILTLQDLHSYSAARSVLLTFDLLELKLVPSDDFVDKNLLKTSLHESFGPFVKGERYSFYSRYVFSTDECVYPSFACFVQHKVVGRGEIVIVAGVSIFSNALLPEGENREALFRLLLSDGKLALDEYHQLFSDLSVWDLLREPAVVIFLGGFALIIIFYLLMGYHSPYELDLKFVRPRESTQGSSFHTLNERLLLKTLSSKDAFKHAPDFQMDMLKGLTSNNPKLFERLLAEESIEGSGLRRAQILLKIHQQFLLKKRGQ